MSGPIFKSNMKCFRIAFLLATLLVGVFYEFSFNVALAEDPEVMQAALTRPYRSVRDAVYRRVDGEKLTADIFRPANDEVCPAVLMIHGGLMAARFPS